MKALMDWLLHLNNEHHWGFAVLTVVVMTGLGVVIGGGIEFGLKALGIGCDKIEAKR